MSDTQRLKIAVDKAREQWESELAKLNDLIAVTVEIGTPQTELVEEQKIAVQAAQDAFEKAANTYLESLGKAKG